MTVQLPYSPLPGADVPGSTAEAQQANNDALATSIPDGQPLRVPSGKRQVGGLVTVTFPGAAQQSNAATITHNWGTAAAVLHSLQDVTGLGAGSISSITANGANSFDLRAWAQAGAPGAGTTVDVAYLAWER